MHSEAVWITIFWQVLLSWQPPQGQRPQPLVLPQQAQLLAVCRQTCQGPHKVP